MNTDPDVAARLLSGRTEMSAPEKDAILEAVLEQVTGERPVAVRSPVWALAAAGAFVLILAIGLPLGLGWFDPDPRPGTDLVARGVGQKPFGFKAICDAAGGCKPGATLIFRVQAPAKRPWFSAFGRRPDGVVAWYFPPTPQQRSTDTRTAVAGGVLPTGVVLAADHPAGPVTIHGQLCSQPLGRPQIRAVYEGNVDPEQLGCTLVEHTFQVAP